MEEEGIVIKKSGDSVLVSMETVSCDSCSHFQICNPGGGKKVIELPNTVGAAEGDRVKVVIENRVFTVAAVLVFGLPIIGLIGGYVLIKKATGSEFTAVMSGMGGVICAFVFLAFYDKNIFGRKGHLHSRIAGIIGGEDARSKDKH